MEEKKDIKTDVKATNKRRLCFYVMFAILAIGFVSMWLFPDITINMPFAKETTDLGSWMLRILVGASFLLFLFGLCFVPKSGGVFIILALLLIPHAFLILVHYAFEESLLEAVKFHIFLVSFGLINLS